MKNKRDENYKPHTMTKIFDYWDGDKHAPIEWEFVIKCPVCASDWIRKDGHPNGKEKQECKCRECGGYFSYDRRFNKCLKLYKISLLIFLEYSQARISRELKIHSSTVKKYVTKYNLQEIAFLSGFQPVYSDFPEPVNKIDIAALNYAKMGNYVDAFNHYYDYEYSEPL